MVSNVKNVDVVLDRVNYVESEAIMNLRGTVAFKELVGGCSLR